MKSLFAALFLLSFCGTASALEAVCKGSTYDGAKIVIEMKSKPMDPNNAYVDQGYTAVAKVFKGDYLVEQKEIKNIILQSSTEDLSMFYSSLNEGFAIYARMGEGVNGNLLIRYDSKHTRMQYMHLYMDCVSI